MSASSSSLSRPVDDDLLRIAAKLSDATLLQQVSEYGDCLGADTEEWFPGEPSPDESKARAAYERRAAELCGDCPVIAECLERALRIESPRTVQPHGIYGGTAPWRRETLIRNRRRTAAARVTQTRGTAELVEVSA